MAKTCSDMCSELLAKSGYLHVKLQQINAP
jgi:hypothetical protein